MLENNVCPAGLKRCFGLRESITITVGTVIGVGLFTVGANVVGILGGAVLWATLAALAISIYPAMLYAEMSAALPFAGGTYQYATVGLSPLWGMLAGWNFVISMVAVASGEALAFSFYIRTLFESLGVLLPVSDVTLACIAVVGFLLLGIFGVEASGRMQNGFLFFFWGVAVVWVLTMLPSLHFGNFQPVGNGLTVTGFFGCVAMVWWCFAGFETCCAMGEEIRYPQVNLPRALLLAPFIVFAVNGLFQWMLLCIVPAEHLSGLLTAAAPYAEGMRLAGIVGFPLVLLCAGIAFGGDFSTLNACITAPARYLYTMARDNAIPGVFSRIHTRFRTPWVSILLLGGVMLLLICTGSIGYIASLSLFATLLYYIIGIVSACGLRRKLPELTRPYRAPGIWIGAAVSILLYLLLLFQLDRDAAVIGILWNVLGILIFCFRCRKRSIQALPPLPPMPDAETKARLDLEFRRWRRVVAFATVTVLALFLFAFIR